MCGCVSALCMCVVSTKEKSHTTLTYGDAYNWIAHRLFPRVIVDRVGPKSSILPVFSIIVFSFYFSFSTWPWHRGDFCFNAQEMGNK